MSRLIQRAPLLVTLAIGLTLLLSAQAQAAAHNEYCSPTGDFCQGVDRSKPPVTLGISTFSFRGNYRLCTRFSTVHTYSCHTFRLRSRGNGIWGSAVRFQRFFPHHRHGRYFARWEQGGYRIGAVVWFRF